MLSYFLGSGSILLLIDFFLIYALQVTLYALTTGLSVENVIDECTSLDTKEFKARLAEKIDAHIAPLRNKYDNLLQDPHLVRDILMFGSQRAEQKARETMAELRELLGFNLSHKVNGFYCYNKRVWSCFN